MMLFPVMRNNSHGRKMAGNRMKLQNTMNDELQMDFHGVPTELELLETLLSLIPARLNVNLGLLSLRQ